MNDKPPTSQTSNSLSKPQIDAISRLLVEARRCAQKLDASMKRREVEPRAEFGALVDAIPSLSEANEWLWQLYQASSDETSDARDAARYRFLRQPGNAIVYAKDRNAWGDNISGHVRWDTAEQLDAAVDAALGSQSKAGEKP